MICGIRLWASQATSFAFGWRRPSGRLCPAYMSPARSYPTMTSMIQFRQFYPFVVLEYAISVYIRLRDYSDERSRSEQCRASISYAPAS